MAALGHAGIPPAVVTAFISGCALAHRGIDTFHRATMAEFMRQGLLARRIGRMGVEYSHRHDALPAVLVPPRLFDCPDAIAAMVSGMP